MSDPRMQAWAKLMVDYSVRVQPGQTVAITGGAAAEPLLRACYREVIRAGGFPILLPALSGIQADLLANGSDEQIDFISPVERFVREEADVVIAVIAESNTRALSGVDPARQSRFQAARRPLIQRYLQRSAEGKLHWVLTLFPTDAHAQDAEKSTEAYTDFVLSALKLNQPDPVEAWRAQSAMHKRMVEWLAGKSEIHLTGPETDLTLSVAGRTWIPCDGDKNLPDGEIFTAPVETSVNGRVRFSYPVIVAGREVVDVRLVFRDGKVVEASASKGEDYLISTLDTDEGSRTLGEFAFGTNFDIQVFSKNILFDEKIGGTVHMAVGAGYPESGSTNQSAVHWDMICDLRQGGKITVDGQLFMENGRYVV